MKVRVKTPPTMITLREVPVGSCVRLASRPDEEIYMRIDNPVDVSYTWVRLNDGAMRRDVSLSGYYCYLVDVEVVVHG